MQTKVWCSYIHTDELCNGSPMRCDATGLELTAYGEKLAVRLHYAVACRHGCRLAAHMH
jgi:hypothetical protein